MSPTMSNKAISGKVDKFLLDGNTNNITNILEILKDENHTVPGILGLERIFTELFRRGDFIIDDEMKLLNKNDWIKKTENASRLWDLYEETWQKLGELLNDSKKSEQKEALSSLMRLMSMECRHPNFRQASCGIFPMKRLQMIVGQLLSSNSSDVIGRFQEFVQYKDVLFYTWRVLKQIVLATKESAERFVINLLNLMEVVIIPKGLPNEKCKVEADELLCLGKGAEPFTLDVVHLRKCVSKVWQNLINQTVGPAVHRRLLLVLLENYLHSVHNPVFLTDFLMGSMSLKGGTALLALQGMSVLMQKHNIEYPNVYGKLYTMFEPEIMQTKFKSRLFYLADIFLSSTHLPEQLVAAFAKRVARLALTAQVPVIIISIKFVGNLLIRHAGLRKLIHHEQGEEVTDDPYDMAQRDPLKSRATESSLWELSVLKKHALPRIAAAASFIDGNLPSIEWDLSEVLDTTSGELFEKETKRKCKNIAYNYVRPQAVAQLKDDRLFKLWTLS